MAAPSAFTRTNVTTIKRGDFKLFTAGEAATTAVTLGRCRDVKIVAKPVYDEKDTSGRRQTVALDITVQGVMMDVDDTLLNRMLDYSDTPMGFNIGYSELAKTTHDATSKYFSRDNCLINYGDTVEFDFGAKKPNELPFQTEFQIHPSEWGAMFTTVAP